jgi:hypothetical protein
VLTTKALASYRDIQLELYMLLARYIDLQLFTSYFINFISREFSTFSFVSTNPELKFTKRQLHLLFHAGAEFGFLTVKKRKIILRVTNFYVGNMQWQKTGED